MKKTLNIFLAAALLVAGSACTKELIESPAPVSIGELRTFTVSIGDDETQTKTDITSKGKTVWKAGDKVWMTNGADSDTITVDSQFDGQRYFEFSTALEGTIYVVYPASAVPEGGALDSDNRFVLEVPETQDGEFASANISVAVASDRYVKMRNVTSVLKFRIPSTVAADVTSVSITGVNNPVGGTFAVDMSSGDPVVSTSDTCSVTGVSVAVNGKSGNFYATVIPGTYNAGFSMTAVSLDLDHAVQSVSTAAQKELKVNDYYDLGLIGDDLQPLGGDGSESNPYLVSNTSELMVVASYVNAGNNLAGKYVKLTDDIDNVTFMIGQSSDADDYPFQGTLDGNGKTVSLNIKKSEDCVGLFGLVADSAYVHDLNIAGTVSSSGSYVGGLAGLVYAASTPPQFDNVSNAATVTGNYCVGGLVGQVNNTSGSKVVFTSCSNSGNITGPRSIGGIVGYGYYADYDGCKNSGSITSTEYTGITYKTEGRTISTYIRTNGCGGIVGYSQNASISDCENSGTITSVNQGGGISGMNYWSSVSDCTNSGKIVVDGSDYESITYTTGNGPGGCGGIIGAVFAIGNVTDCVNTGDIECIGATQWVGGILGNGETQFTSTSRNIVIRSCVNKGNIKAEAGSGFGGIAGHMHHSFNAPTRVDLYYCVNDGDITVTEGNRAAGIAGYVYDHGSYTMAQMASCINNGDVTVEQGGYASGFIGHYGLYYQNRRTDMRNCENHGDIYAYGQCAGAFTGYTSASNGQACYLYNCLNDGDIQYGNAELSDPRCGGLIGFGAIRAFNVYTGGKVGLKEGTPHESAVASVGSVAGNVTFHAASYVYYLEGTCENAIGTSSATDASSFTSVSSDGTLANVVTVNGSDYINVVDALNAYVAPNAGFYCYWTTGPKFNRSGDFNLGGDLDLGYGGEL